MSERQRQEAILELLDDFHGLESLRELFWSKLNYHRVNQPLSRRGWTATQSGVLAEDPVLFASAGDEDAFRVIYCRLDDERLLLTRERTIVSKLLRAYPYVLFIFSNKSQDHCHLVNVKYDPEVEDAKKRRLFRRITIGPEEHHRTASERILGLDIESIESARLFEPTPLEIQIAHDQAFDVEAVTNKFFEEFKARFEALQRDLKNQTGDSSWAHEYALLFLSRVMFLYFVQRKRWLGNDTEFLRTFWEAYRKNGQPQDTFFSQWLSVLFFEAFNNRFHGGHRQFPEEIREALSTAPYLNGGLFSKNDLDSRYAFTIGDSQFKDVFDFLEGYNFTIAEDTPLDQEVAVDPEMIGKVYESLVNIGTEVDLRGEAGIFYTPRLEISMMCRLALVDYLANHLGEEHKSALYEAAFALDDEEKAAADDKLLREGLWPQVSELVESVKIVDPACGSGSFLVAMMQLLADLRQRAQEQLGTGEGIALDRYRLKERGCDGMGGARG